MTFPGKVDNRPKRLYFCTFGLATILIWQTPINEQELTIEDGNQVSYLISFIVHCDKICNIFLLSWFDRGRNKHHLRCCFTIWGFQIKIHFKLNLMGFPYKKYFKALILLNVNTLSNISTKWQMVQKASWVERCRNGICLTGRSEFSWTSQSPASSLPMDQHKETEQEENGVLWNKDRSTFTSMWNMLMCKNNWASLDNSPWVWGNRSWE